MTYVARRQRVEKRKKKFKMVAIAVLAVAIICLGILYFIKWRFTESQRKYINGLQIPEFSGQAYVVINDNVPFFEENNMTTQGFERYNELDTLGRCGVAYANVSRDLMPTEARGEIGSIKPSGWQQAKYGELLIQVLLISTIAVT